ncbi:hypothetical protein HA075_24110 [bacterium BFN5]|nr:hypothetical protein HA075_24110 [bacterium BFN5]
MSKKIIISSLLLLLFVFSGICYAAEIPNPFKGLTQEQVVKKYFEGRELDLIEGIWLGDYDQLRPEIIIKASLVDKTSWVDFENADKYDYFKIQFFPSSENAKIIGIRKTQYTSAFLLGKVESSLRFISSTTLVELSGYYYSQNFHKFYTRIYPNEVK